jgi:hypothetical protein
MNAATKVKTASTVAPTEPTWTDAVALLEAARAEGGRELTAEEQDIIGRARSRAGRAGEMAIIAAGQLYDVACRRREVQAHYAASERAQDRRKSFLATRAAAWAEVPPHFQLAWILCERSGGRATAEGRALARLLEDLSRGEQLATPDCFQPPPPEHP